MSLRDEQSLFTADLAELILYANALPGYEVVLAEVYRPPEMAELYASRGVGIRNSQHTKKLAADVLLFIDGEYQQQSDAYLVLGEWWEQRRPGNVWGGRFTRADGNHFERQLSKGAYEQTG